MGKAVEAEAVKRSHTIAGRIDSPEDWNSFSGADVAIEFTQPEAAAENICRCIDMHLPVLSGTTGWLGRKPEVDEYCRKKGGTFFYASNFSLGVNLLFRLNAQLAVLMNGRSEYQVSIDETHHTAKKDAPSGTAITLANALIQNLPHIEKWSTPDNPGPRSVVIRSHRVDPAPGTHEVIFRSAHDEIRIRHEAFSREGFASGAVDVAEWLPGQSGVLGMDDFLPQVG
jgi:4-hydroxy-tetrahydrodipicolinate reductase